MEATLVQGHGLPAMAYPAQGLVVPGVPEEGVHGTLVGGDVVHTFRYFPTGDAVGVLIAVPAGVASPRMGIPPLGRAAPSLAILAVDHLLAGWAVDPRGEGRATPAGSERTGGH